MKSKWVISWRVLGTVPARVNTLYCVYCYVGPIINFVPRDELGSGNVVMENMDNVLPLWTLYAREEGR